MRKFIRKTNTIVATTLLSAAGVLVLPCITNAVPNTHAAVGSCRSDPVFTLVSGKTITLQETITDSKSDVSGASYILHIPVGQKIKSISYTGAVGSQQSMTWYADEAAGKYDSYTTVLTKSSNIPVTAYLTVGTKNSTSVAGFNNQALHNQLVGV